MGPFEERQARRPSRLVAVAALLAAALAPAAARADDEVVIEGTVERRTGLTWATRVGDWPALLACIALVALGRMVSRWTSAPKM